MWQHGQFHRTADRLGLTQSTVSGRVAALETALGRRLFTRSRAGTDLTTEGLKFEPFARSLRREWTESLRAVQSTASTALSLRLGMQPDLAGSHIGDWVSEFRRTLPDTAFYIELDYSIQMCLDIARGALDFGVMFSPAATPDLHFASVGEMRYRLVSTETDRRAGLRWESYISAEYSPAFMMLHRQMLPEFTDAPIASGQNASVAGMLGALGGSAFVLEETAAQLVAEGRVQLVADVAAIGQPVYTAVHIRNRTSHLHRRLASIVRGRFVRR